MKRLLVDTNVILDVLLDRQPHADVSIAIWAAIEAGHAEGYLAAHSITTIHYLIRPCERSRQRRCCRCWT
jgi:predicted nucleic acid-binding protein